MDAKAGSSQASSRMSLNSFSTSYYRVILDIIWIGKIQNDNIYETTQQEPLTQTIQRRQLRFIGHNLRQNTNEFIKIYALYTPKSGQGKVAQNCCRLQSSIIRSRMMMMTIMMMYFYLSIVLTGPK